MSTSRTAADGEPGPSDSSLARVVAEAERIGLGIRLARLDAGTRTAEDAARACGCELDQIVKSIVFRVAITGRHLLFLTAGGNRVDPEKAGALVGATLEKADAASIRAETGFAIGGVAPIGHLKPIETFLDPRLLDFPVVWAAAGTPFHVFCVDPRQLRKRLAPRVADFVI